MARARRPFISVRRVAGTRWRPDKKGPAGRCECGQPHWTSFAEICRESTWSRSTFKVPRAACWRAPRRHSHAIGQSSFSICTRRVDVAAIGRSFDALNYDAFPMTNLACRLDALPEGPAEVCLK